MVDVSTIRWFKAVIALLACLVVASRARAQQPARPSQAPEQLRLPAAAETPESSTQQPTPVDDDEFALPEVLKPTPFGDDPLSPRIADPNQVTASPAINQPLQPQSQSPTTIRLAQTPKMLGDFFGSANSCIVVGYDVGDAVHQTIGSGSASAANNLRLVELDTNTNRWVFVGGPSATGEGTFLEPTIAPPLMDVVTDLTGNGVDSSVGFTAVETEGLMDVFDNPGDTSPSLDDVPVYNVFQVEKLYLPVANPGDLVGRVRMQDNNSAMPQNRVYFDYNYFHNVRFTNNGINVNRFVPGIERTFLDGLGSIEVRVPVAATLNSQSRFGQQFDASHVAFGNLTIAPKLLLWSSENTAFAVGMGISLPTADDIEVFSSSGQLLNIDNGAVHLVPYLGYLYAPRKSNYFVHSFLTLDVDTSGNDVSGNVSGTGLEHIGVIEDQTLLSCSVSLGKYVYRNPTRVGPIRSLAWTGELHYTTTLDGADVIQAGAFQVGSTSADLSLLNGTIGTHAQLRRSTLTVGYTVPMNSDKRLFDGEFRLFVNRPF